VTADMVDSLAKRHFPACQYNLWKRLKMDRHLKHHARLQFGLFLKVSETPERSREMTSNPFGMRYSVWDCHWMNL
jgi:DNA primase large subunit